VVLAPYDNVLILRQPNFELQRTVFVGGEVRSPGRYSLRTRGERLSDVVARAGGTTELADGDAVTFYRTREAQGRIGVDLRGVLRDARHRENLLLEDGDSIVVARRQQVVLVEGGVNAPTAVPYVPGANIDYYVRAAGGPSVRGLADRAYVTQGNGKVESIRRRRVLADDVPEPMPGARVVVPERPENGQNPPPPPSQLLGTIVQIVGAAATLIFAIATINR
jgi:protein involved in polysaccharide export with SLBB domain